MSLLLHAHGCCCQRITQKLVVCAEKDHAICGPRSVMQLGRRYLASAVTCSGCVQSCALETISSRLVQLAFLFIEHAERALRGNAATPARGLQMFFVANFCLSTVLNARHDVCVRLNWRVHVWHAMLDVRRCCIAQSSCVRRLNLRIHV